MKDKVGTEIIGGSKCWDDFSRCYIYILAHEGDLYSVDIKNNAIHRMPKDGQCLNLVVLVCPDCGKELRPGPQGGMSVNMTCDSCGKFNMTPLGVERI